MGISITRQETEIHNNYVLDDGSTTRAFTTSSLLTVNVRDQHHTTWHHEADNTNKNALRCFGTILRSVGCTGLSLLVE
jgi:hypothetical protein